MSRIDKDEIDQVIYRSDQICSYQTYFVEILKDVLKSSERSVPSQFAASRFNLDTKEVSKRESDISHTTFQNNMSQKPASFDLYLLRKLQVMNLTLPKVSDYFQRLRKIKWAHRKLQKQNPQNLF